MTGAEQARVLEAELEVEDLLAERPPPTLRECLEAELDWYITLKGFPPTQLLCSTATLRALIAEDREVRRYQAAPSYGGCAMLWVAGRSVRFVINPSVPDGSFRAERVFT